MDTGNQNGDWMRGMRGSYSVAQFTQIILRMTKTAVNVMRTFKIKVISKFAATEIEGNRTVANVKREKKWQQSNPL